MNQESKARRGKHSYPRITKYKDGVIMRGFSPAEKWEMFLLLQELYVERTPEQREQERREKLESYTAYYQNYRRYMEKRIALGKESPEVEERWKKFVEWSSKEE